MEKGMIKKHGKGDEKRDEKINSYRCSKKEIS